MILTNGNRMQKGGAKNCKKTFVQEREEIEVSGGEEGTKIERNIRSKTMKMGEKKNEWIY